MHTVELLEEALEKAHQLGFEVRQDWLGGNGGGHCLVRGRKWLLLDLAQPQTDQLEVVAEALRSESQSATLDFSPELAERLHLTRAA
jgi:CheY-like chemotaxis protein